MLTLSFLILFFFLHTVIFALNPLFRKCHSNSSNMSEPTEENLAFNIGEICNHHYNVIFLQDTLIHHHHHQKPMKDNMQC